MSDEKRHNSNDEQLAEQLRRDEEILYEETNKQNEEIEAEVRKVSKFRTLHCFSFYG